MKSGIKLRWVMALLFTLFILPTISFVSAGDQTQQFNKIFLDPFYRDSLNGGTNYTYSLTVNPPDGISNVKSAIITIDSYINPTRTFSLWVNGQTCNNPVYTVSTTYAGAGKATVYFDCSNRITNAGVYNVTIQVNNLGIGATTVWLDLTYQNNPLSKMDLFGTEYQIGDSGTTFIQLLNDYKQPINNANCYISAYYPDKSTLWNNALLNYLPNSSGLYYKDFTAPSTRGIYMLSSTCFFPATSFQDHFDDISLISAYNNITIQNSYAKLTDVIPITDRWATVSDLAQTTGPPNGQTSATAVGGWGDTFNISGVTNSMILDTTLIYVFSIGPTGLTDDSVTLRYCDSSPGCTTYTNLYVFNSTNAGTSVSYLNPPYFRINVTGKNITQLTNMRLSFLYTKVGGQDSNLNIDAFGISPLFPQDARTNGYIMSIPASLGTSPSWDSFNATYSVNQGSITFKILDVNNNTLCTGLGDIKTCAGNTTPIKLYATLTRPISTNISPTLDDWSVKWFINGTVQEVKGAGELHINNIPSDVWNFQNRNLTNDGNQLVANAVWGYTGNISSNILGQETNSTWNYSGIINPNILAQQTNSTWNYGGIISNNILNQFAVAVWNNFNATNQFIQLITESVWTRTDRNLTYYKDVTNYTRIDNSINNATAVILTDINNTQTHLDNSIANGTTVVISAINNLSVALNNDTSIITNAIANGTTVTVNAVNNTQTHLDNSIANGTTVVVGAINNTQTHLDNSITNGTTVVIGAINNTQSYLDNSIINGTTTVVNRINDVNNSLSNQINNLSSSLQNDASSIINSITNGTAVTVNAINNTQTYLDNSIINGTTTVVNRINDVNSSLSNQITNVNNSLSNQIAGTQSSIDASIANSTGVVIGAINNTQNHLDNSISNATNVLSNQITNVNNSLSNQIQNVPNAVWNYNGTINPSILQQFADTVWFTFNNTHGFVSLITESVWTRTDRNLTFYPAQVDLTNYTQVAEYVWNNAIRNLTYYENFGDQTNYTRINVEVPVYVWNYTTRNLTYYEHVDMTNYSQAAQYVWEYVNRSLTSEFINNISAQEIWAYTNRTLTYYQNFGDQTNYTKMVEDVWAYVNRSLTYYQNFGDQTNYTLINEGVTNSVWTAPNRNLTYYQNFGDQTNYTQIILGVWSATDRNLTFYPAQTDLTNYTAITDNVVNGVWNATNRNLTFYPQQIDLTNYSQIADVVWNANSRNLTFTEDVTNYSQIIVGVWNYQDRNLTFYPVQVDLTNYTLINDMIINSSVNYTLVADNVWQWNGVIVQSILNQIGSSTAQNVWNATDRNLTFYPTQVDLTNYTLIQESVWQNLNRTLTDFNFTVSVNETAISNAVWTSVTRTLTDFNFTVTADVNNSAIANAVWAAVNRTLTDYNQSDLTDYNKIQQMVWNATDRNLTYYQNFGDQTNYTLIQEMVWTATQRTLTELNMTVDVNTTAIANAVWASVNRTLTDYNQSDLTNYNLIQTMVWNATIRTLTDFNMTVNASIDTSAVAGAVWNYTNKTVDFATTGTTENVSLVQNIQNMGHVYVGGTEYTAGEAGRISIRLVRGTGALAAVETGANCQVTINYPNTTEFVSNVSMTELGSGVYYYDFIVPTNLGIYMYYTNCNVSDRNYYSLDDFHIYANNYSSIAGDVWNYTTRNLTFYPDTNISVNVTVTGNNLTAQDVWNNPTRDLTYYPTANLTLSNESVQELGSAVWQYSGTINSNILSQFANAITCTLQKLETDLNLKPGVQLNSC